MTGADNNPEQNRNVVNPEQAGKEENPDQAHKRHGGTVDSEELGLRADRWASGNPVLPAGFSGEPATALRLPGVPEKDGGLAPEQLAEAAEPLTDSEIVKLLDLRKLPGDHPGSPERRCKRFTEPQSRKAQRKLLTFVDGGSVDEPLFTSLAIARVVRAVLARSGVADVIERELRSAAARNPASASSWCFWRSSSPPGNAGRTGAPTCARSSPGSTPASRSTTASAPATRGPRRGTRRSAGGSSA